MKPKLRWGFLSGVLFLSAAVTLVLVLSGCNKPGGGPKPIKITPLEAEGQLRNDFAVLVDVREAHEIKDGMAARARWLPFSKIETHDPQAHEFLTGLPKDKQIIFYCRSGRRSAIAAEVASAHGLKAADMGGYSDWVKAGLPTKKPDAALKPGQ